MFETPQSYFAEGHAAYQVGKPILANPYRRFTRKHHEWANGYRAAEQAADPDGLAPRKPSYDADINIPRERLFSLKDKVSEYSIFIMAYNTTSEPHTRILYIRARSQAEAFGQAALMNNRNGVLMKNWRIERCPVADLQTIADDVGLQMFEYQHKGTLKEKDMPEPTVSAKED